jgi:hypothetical protein
VKRNDLMTHLVDWRGQMFGIRFGLWWITLRGPKKPAMFTERRATEPGHAGKATRVVRLLFGWRIVAHKND